jgi:hypothetical protein
LVAASRSASTILNENIVGVGTRTSSLAVWALEWESSVEMQAEASQRGHQMSEPQDELTKIHVVLSELIDGQTADGEHVIIIDAYRDPERAERRAEAERVCGAWGIFDADGVSDEGWCVSVRAVDLIDSRAAVSQSRPEPLTKIRRRTVQLANMDGTPPVHEVDQDVIFASWDGGKSWVLQCIADRGPVRRIVRG